MKDIYAIFEWDIKFRRWTLREADYGETAKRRIRTTYRVLAARYPNNSFRLAELSPKVLEESIVHRDAENAEGESK